MIPLLSDSLKRTIGLVSKAAVTVEKNKPELVQGICHYVNRIEL